MTRFEAVATKSKTGVPTRAAERAPARPFAGAGTALRTDLRETMGRRLGWDFSRVRVHAGPDAAGAAAAEGTHAFTIGHDIAFAEGRFRPQTAGGLRLLAHELAHVVQQSRGGARPAGDASLERAAGQAAESAAAGRAVAVGGASGVGLARETDEEKAKRLAAADAQARVPIGTDMSGEWPPRHPRYSFPPLYQLRPPASLTGPAPTDAGALKPPVAPAPAPAIDDPQPATPTLGNYQGAQAQNPGVAGFALSGQYGSIGPGGGGLTLGGTAGIAQSGAWALEGVGGVGGQFDGQGQYTAGTLGPAGLHLAYTPGWRGNFGLYLTGSNALGQSPAGRGQGNPGGAATLVGEYPIGGAGRDQPRVLLGGNLGAAYQRYTPISAIGSSLQPTPGTTLRNAWSETATGSVQYNPSYHTFADGSLTKTPRDTIFGEVSGTHVGGGAYTDAATPPVSGSSYALTAGLGYMHNFRLDSGRTILSLGPYAGFRAERDEVGGRATPAYGVFGGGILGLSFRPDERRKKNDE